MVYGVVARNRNLGHILGHLEILVAHCTIIKMSNQEGSSTLTKKILHASTVDTAPSHGDTVACNQKLTKSTIF